MVQTGHCGGEAKAERIVIRGYMGKAVGESLLEALEEGSVCLNLYMGCHLHERPLLGLHQAAQMSQNMRRHFDS